MDREREENVKEIALSDGEYLYTQDKTSGTVKVHTGPTVVNIAGQEEPVSFDPEQGKFIKVELGKALRRNPIGNQGYYIILYNPINLEKLNVDKDELEKVQKCYCRQQPHKGQKTAIDLTIGQKVNVPGPITFPLWPRQVAKVIKGHQLKSNEYLLVRVYDEDQAKAHWGNAIIKTNTSKEKILTDVSPENFSTGKLFNLRGTEVSFFIPPTGIEVVPQGDNQYIRDALTLENLQYCITQSEDGSKSYQRGPKVVFPNPTERFFTQKNSKGVEEKIFRPIELNEIQGLHIKIIADYAEDDKHYWEGDELFLTGKDVSIYYPRHEHSLVNYDGQSKHFATAIPSGEARYIMNRKTGIIETKKGPKMLLPDPREEVIVRRVLSDSECELLYPDSLDTLEYNQGIRELSKKAPTTRQGVISEGEIERSKFKSAKQQRSLLMSYANADTNAILADSFSRGSTYSQPRTLTLDTKFSGVPTVNVWTGYAVMVISKTGERQVIEGPATILLDYDQGLESLELSTGKPKADIKMIKTGYLRVKNNQISDIIEVETSDHVSAKVSLSLRTNFEDDSEKWFEVDNYVKLLTDRIRSILKNETRKHSVENFIKNQTEIIRDVLLGEKVEGGVRRGILFKENNMKLYDVEVLAVIVGDKQIAALLEDQQHYMVESTITLAKRERTLVVFTKEQEIARSSLEEKYKTDSFKSEKDKETIERDKNVFEIRNGFEDLRFEKKKISKIKEDELANVLLGSELERITAREHVNFKIEQDKQDLTIKEQEASTKAVVERFNAASGSLSEAIITASNQDLLSRVAESTSVQAMLGGRNFVDVMQNMFKDTPIKDIFSKTVKKASKVLGGDRG